VSYFLEFIREVLEAIDRTVGLDRPGWRIFALIVSPIVTLVAFYLNQRGRRELKEQAHELGVLQQRVDTSQQELHKDRQLLSPKLARGWLVASSYQFAQYENQLMMRQLLLQQIGMDVRYRLAHALLQPEISRNYRVIIFDLPPRMSLGSINALIASHYLVVPTILDKLSSEAVGQFLANMSAIRDDLRLDLQLAGIIGTMSLGAELRPSEQRIWDDLESAGHAWRNGTDFRISPTIRRAAAISKAAGEELAYLSGGQDGQIARELFQPVFHELAKRIGVASP
jgi:cellulose biosynthesis protein BcsQ